MAGRRRSDRALRAEVARSPGRPGVARREDRRRFWAAIAAGQSSEDAAVGAGVSQAVGSRWFREAGGMPPSTLARSSKPPSGRYLSFAEREEIALLRAQGYGVREVARRLGRAASTVSRELRRNAATRSGGLEYRATTAQWHAERAARRPKPAKLAVNAALRAYVQERLAGRRRRSGRGRGARAGGAVEGPAPRAAAAPALGEGVEPASRSARRLRLDFPGDETMRISHEAIYQALYVQGRGALRRELTACLRTGRALRVPRARSRGRRQVACRARGDDQPAPGGGGRPGGAGALGGGPHPRPGQLGDRHAGGAHDAVHDAAPPAPHAGPRGGSAREERARRSPGTARRRCATPSRARSPPCRSSCGGR